MTADMSLADIDALLSVNVRAVVLTSQAAMRHLGEGGASSPSVRPSLNAPRLREWPYMP